MLLVYEFHMKQILLHDGKNILTASIIYTQDICIYEADVLTIYLQYFCDLFSLPPAWVTSSILD